MTLLQKPLPIQIDCLPERPFPRIGSAFWSEQLLKENFYSFYNTMPKEMDGSSLRHLLPLFHVKPQKMCAHICATT